MLCQVPQAFGIFPAVAVEVVSTESPAALAPIISWDEAELLGGVEKWSPDCWPLICVPLWTFLT